MHKWTHPLDNLLNNISTNPNNSKLYRTGLFLNNSLNPDEKTEFVTSDGSRNVKWYICGPTVYDSAHLGHARTYLSFDILRRVMEKYFGYNISLCMNVTDIDDKIINRSNEQNKDYLEFTKFYEDEFFSDMKKLNVSYPNYITRVSEYIDEIVQFIKVLVEKNYAYVSNGSVYFDIENYTKCDHIYAKLDPNKIKSNELKVSDLDGDLAVGTDLDKKNKGDFALWKKSKDNEPAWDSPFGSGRPGWHIECSAMCSTVFGDKLDIHCGGCDLKFPHHDNEIAQSEAYFDVSQWTNYFLHTGHLNIEGLKMSKSLKNFKKISEFIDKYNANTFRLFFITHSWDSDMNFTEDALREAYETEKYIGEFFQNLKVWIRENDMKKTLKPDSIDNNMNELLYERKLYIHEALCNNINTPPVVKTIIELISKFYEYETKTRGTESRH